MTELCCTHFQGKGQLVQRFLFNELEEAKGVYFVAYQVQTLVSDCAYCFSMCSNSNNFILKYHESALTATKVARGLF